MLRKGEKAHKPNKAGKGVKRPLVTARPATPTAAARLPIISTLEFPAPVLPLTDPSQAVRKWCFKHGSPVINPLLKKSYFADDKEIILSEGPAPSYSLKRGKVVRVNRQNIKIPGDVPLSSWSEIIYEETSYDRALKQWVTSRVIGWVNDAYLDDYHEQFPDFEVEIPNATKDSTDAQQFMFIKDEGEFNVKTNMCGQLCVAFVIKENIDTVLDNWRKKGKKNYYGSLVGKGQNKTTTQEHLKDILDLYYTNADDVLPFKEGLVAIPLAAPANEPNYPHASNELQERLKTHSLITLVRIDLNNGELNPVEHAKPRNHWIVVDKITRNGNGVEIYNPFPNKRQEYSFQEFYKSMGSNPSSGWWVKRNDFSLADLAEQTLKLKLPMKVRIENPNPTYKAAQYIDVDGKKMTQMCGEFCVAFIVKKSIDTVLENWKQVRPKLYAYIMGNNKFGKNMETGTFELGTILELYGYKKGSDFMEFSAGLIDPYTKRSLPSPGGIAKMLETYLLIAGVNIDGITGKLKPGNDVRHWVVVNKLTPVGRETGGNGGWVEIYNPFQNRWEEYSYKEFIQSVGVQGIEPALWVSWSGLWVKRGVKPKFTPQVVLEPIIEDKVNPGRKPRKNGKVGKWTEGQLLVAIRQRSQRGIPANKIAVELAEKSGWKRLDILSILKKMVNVTKFGKWSEAQLHREFEKRRQTGKPVNKIAAELAAISGWKRQDIIGILKKVVKAGGAEKWTEEQLVMAIKDQLKSAKPVNKNSAALVEISGWKKWQISKILKNMAEAEKMTKNRSRSILDNKSAIVVDPKSIIHASKRLAEFVEWQNSLLSLPDSKLYRVRKWGDPVMVKYGFDVSQAGTSNFQAVGLYNDGVKEFGAVTNFIRISHDEVMRLKALQIEDNYVAKRDDWRRQKMNWLCKYRGTIYFHDNNSDTWSTAPHIRWGTLALGGNLVQVEGTEIIRAKLRNGVKGEVGMARLKGFRMSDWDRPLDDLLAEGLVHRCFCAYHHNHFGDSPKGIVYSPFYSTLDWDFVGTTKPNALYIPVEWLEPKDS